MPEPWKKYQAHGEVGPWTKYADPSSSLDARAQDVFGFDPTLDRGAILPLARNQQGEMEFALPQIGIDLAKAALLPGHVMQGGQYTEDDVTRAALDISPIGRTPGAKRLSTKRQFIRSAPARETLEKQSRKFYDEARARGVVVDGESVLDMVTRVENNVGKIGPSPTLAPKATGVLNEWAGRLGKDLTLEDLQVMREEAGIVAGSNTPKERAIGQIMKNEIDAFIDNLSDKNVVSGDPVNIGDTLKRARSLWQRQAKVRMVDEIFETAESTASGFENGLRIEFRKIVRNPKKRRSFTPDEIAAMKKVANGGPVQGALRLLRHLGPGTGNENRYLGTAIGATAGTAVGGPALGLAMPAVGHLAGRAAARNTTTNAEMARALMATGGQNPQTETLVRQLMRRGLGPVAGTQIGPNGGLIVGGEEVF